MLESGLITQEYVNTVIKERGRDIHKGDCGKVLVIAGSEGMAGAAVLCSRGALAAGAGLVRVCIPRELFPILQIAVPEATCIDRTLSKLNLDDYDAVAAGPGLGDDAETEVWIKTVLAGYRKTLVLDADGLNVLSKTGQTRLLRKASCRVIVTPHIGEARRLLGEERAAKMWPKGETLSGEQRREMAGLLARETGAIVCLKGAGTIVASEKEGSYTNTTGNPGMATGGAGDVLTGIICALAGQKIAPWDSAKAGVFLHGKAGDLAAEAKSEQGLTAMDIANMTAFAFKEKRV